MVQTSERLLRVMGARESFVAPTAHLAKPLEFEVCSLDFEEIP